MRRAAIFLLALGLADDASSAATIPVFSDAGVRASMASIVVARPAKDVFVALANPGGWPRLFSDVRSVERRPGASPVWRVVSRILGDASIELRAVPDRLVHFHVIDAGPGGALVIDVRMEPIAPALTRVVYRMETTLPLGLDAVLDADAVRAIREKKIVVDLVDLERSLRRGE